VVEIPTPNYTTSLAQIHLYRQYFQETYERSC